MAEAEAVRAIRRFRERLLAVDATAARRLVEAYGPIYSRLAGDIERLLADVEGRQMTFSQVMRLNRLESIQAQIERVLAAYGDAAAAEVATAQAEASGIARASTRRVVDAALPTGLTTEALGELGLSWNALPESAFESFVGIAGDGEPLGRLLAELGPEVRENVTREIANGIARGQSPRETARLVRDQFGGGLTRSLRIARTETLRAYREATRAQYVANRTIVKGYRRRAAQNSATCMACIALDGREYPIGTPLNEHVNGRCVLVPITVTYQDLGLNITPIETPVPNARTWFEGQGAGTQRAMMGAGRYDLWRAGGMRLEDMAVVRPNPVWGDQAVVRPLRELAG